MFDPRRYRDADYGLDEGESFEPGDDTGPDVDLTQPHIMTVLGPIEPDDLGLCLIHERLGEPPSAAPGLVRTGRHNLSDIISDELEAFALSGGRGVVDVTTKDTGRRAGRLLGLVRHAPMHLVASTGSLGVPRPGIGAAVEDAEDLALEWIADLRDGMDATAARAGLIAVTLGPAVSNGDDRRLLDAVAAAHRETGAPIALRASTPPKVPEALDRLAGTGVSAGAVIIQGMDGATPPALLRSLAERGAVCSFDRISGTGADRRDALAIARLAEAGLAASVVLSMNVGWAAGGGSAGVPIWPYLLEQFTVMLMDHGLDAATVRGFLVENPARALTIRPASPIGQ